jgi:pimeloyl-ACP methyl ester carboxylesterase
MIALDRLKSDVAAPAPILERTIAAPHPDIELGVERQALRSLVALPKAGIGDRTGLVLFLVGYGQDPVGAYVRSLLPWIADSYDCVAASVSYFGVDNWTRDCRTVPSPGFFTQIERHYGIKVTMPKDMAMSIMLWKLAHLFECNGVTTVHPDCLIYGIGPEYNSMGLLPALDGLAVVHALLGEFALDRRRLFLLGTSYGGFVAGLMAKLAPQTFRMVIDNSGFSSAQDDAGNIYGFAGVFFGNVKIRGKLIAAFSSDPTNAAYYSPARDAIRSLLRREHAHPNSARIYAYHAASDRIAPTERKLLLRDVYAGRAAYDLTIVDQAGLDGRVFKTLEHGMKASMRGLFALSHDKFEHDGGALADDTDFDREACWTFPCGDESYVVRFSRAAGVTARITPLG